MNAGEKVAWVELIISLSAVVAVTALYPWFGNKATSAFGVLGFLAFTVLLMRRRGQKVVMDERDREISERSTRMGVNSAWMMMFISLAVLVIWSSNHNGGVVPVVWLTWLVWVQFAVCYAVKGLMGILSYRGGRHAA